MTTQQQHLQKIQTISTDLLNFKEEINNLRLPFAYFKKFNILPINFIEGELDKYFEYGVLMFENLNHNDYPKLLEFTTLETWRNFYNYHNLPIELFNEMNHTADVFMFRNMLLKNLDFYKSINVVSEGQYEDWIEQIKEDKTITINKHEDRLHKHWLRYNEINEEYIDRVPLEGCFSNNWEGSVLYHNAEGFASRKGWKIIKVCNKIIKYYSNYEEKNKQIKIEEFKSLITNNNACKYQLCFETIEGEHIGVYQYNETIREDGSSSRTIRLNDERANKIKREY